MFCVCEVWEIICMGFVPSLRLWRKRRSYSLKFTTRRANISRQFNSSLPGTRTPLSGNSALRRRRLERMPRGLSFGRRNAKYSFSAKKLKMLLWWPILCSIAEARILPPMGDWLATAKAWTRPSLGALLAKCNQWWSQRHWGCLQKSLP